MYDRPRGLSAFQAASEAQKLAFSPVAFQATVVALRLGVLDAVAQAGKKGIGVRELADQLGLGEYGVGVLLDMGLSAGLVWRDDGRYVLDKIGAMVLHDEMTRVNLNFVKDICYAGLDDLQAAIETGRPAGLKHLGDWPTLYPGLKHLDEPAQTSWFAFDHYYSSKAFPEALKIVFASRPRHLLDLGGNTGKWALACADYDPSVRITIADLPEQTAMARKRTADTAQGARIATYDVDLLDPSQSLPTGADTIWMSQFLDCFSQAQIVSILERAVQALPADGALFVLEPLWDQQAEEAAAYSLNATSLYFTAIANGTSRMYESAEMRRMIEAGGLRIVASHDDLGLGHTLLHCIPQRP